MEDSDISDKEFADLMRKYRFSKTVADMLGVSVSTLIRWSEGTNLPFKVARNPAYDIVLAYHNEQEALKAAERVNFRAFLKEMQHYGLTDKQDVWASW